MILTVYGQSEDRILMSRSMSSLFVSILFTVAVMRCKPKVAECKWYSILSISEKWFRNGILEFRK